METGVRDHFFRMTLFVVIGSRYSDKVSSIVEEHVPRENYPLTLAWALTYWKAQGMTLESVRVHLSAKQLEFLVSASSRALGCGIRGICFSNKTFPTSNTS
mgnify:CR=1 FL=1